MNQHLVKYSFFQLPLQYDKSALISSNKKGRINLVAWSGGQNEILFASFDSTLSSVDYKLKYVNNKFDDLYVADVNGDHVNDLVLVNKLEKSIAFVLKIASDSLRVTGTMELPFEPTRVLIGDYNNDKLTDVLVYDRQTPGILPLIGIGKGRFKQGRIIVPDNAIGSASFAHINDDNLIDLIVWDWVKNELHILYGVGRGRFIDQSTFPYKEKLIRSLPQLWFAATRSIYCY